jgi:hypothetical protein
MIANFIRNSSGLSRLHPALFFRFSSDAGAGNNVEITK